MVICFAADRKLDFVILHRMRVTDCQLVTRSAKPLRTFPYARERYVGDLYHRRSRRRMRAFKSLRRPPDVVFDALSVDRLALR